MPPLPNPRHESFAQSCARGASLDDAFEDAGFVHGHRHDARMAQRPDIAARLAELRAEHADLAVAANPSIIATTQPVMEFGEVFGKVTLKQ